MSYCKAIVNLPKERRHLHKNYHDNEYGFPVDDDKKLFERLVLEINQAGLSWELMLKKRQNFRKAYGGFNIHEVAAYANRDRQRLLRDEGVIRNRLKINAAIENAQAILKIQEEFGSFGIWIEAHHPLSKDEWVRLFKKNFKFVGGEIVNEFLMSIGVLPGAHDRQCPVYARILKAKPLWSQIIHATGC